MEEEFRLQISFYLSESFRKIAIIWQSLDEQQLWLRPNEQTLAPANQLLHLTGNMRQWVGAALAGEPNVRKRDAEFSAREGMTKQQIWEDFLAVYTYVKTHLDQPHDLLHMHTVQGHRTTELGIWIHMVEHMSYHTGQLIFFAKHIQNKEFDFYSDWQLNDGAE